MSELELGDKFSFLRHVLTIHSVGRVTVLVGRGVCLGIGPAVRGPAMEPFGIMGSQPSLVRSTYYAGPLCDDLETALDQGCSVAFGMRVMGQNYATAGMNLVDSQAVGVGVGRLDATGPGTWGSIPTIEFKLGDLDGPKTEIFNGDGTEGPYALLMDDIVQDVSTFTHVKVNGEAKTIVYSGTPDPGQVKIDKVVGSILFATGQVVPRTVEIEVRYKYKSRTMVIRDENTLPMTIPNIMDPVMLNAKLRNNTICRYTPATGATHLPKVMAAAQMTGGAEGDPITINDWELAFNALYETLSKTVIPSTIFATTYEATNGQNDIIPLMDAYLKRMAHKKRPLQGFISLNPVMTTQAKKDLVNGYNNLWMTLISNGYSQTERNLAPARAGQEAAIALGTSPAAPSQVLVGVDGLLYQENEVDTQDLFNSGIEVLVKETGVHCYQGISTDPDQNLSQTTDVRTIAAVIVAIDTIIAKFYDERRTLTNITRIQNSIELYLKVLMDQSILDDSTIKVSPGVGHNEVKTDCWIQPVGHMKQFYTDLFTGFWSDAVAQ